MATYSNEFPFAVTVTDVTTTEPNALVVTITGELDAATADHAITPALQAVERRRPLCLDLSDCTFIDTIGLRFVLRLDRDLAKAETPMAVVATRPQICRTFSLTAMDDQLPIFETLSEAVSWLVGPGITFRRRLAYE